jgi:hypothetical protein
MRASLYVVISQLRRIICVALRAVALTSPCMRTTRNALCLGALAGKQKKNNKERKKNPEGRH